MISRKAFCFNHKQEPLELCCSELLCNENKQFYCTECISQAHDHIYIGKHPV